MIRIIPLLLLIAVGSAADSEPATLPTPVPPDPAADVPPPPPVAARRAGTRVARVAGNAPTWDGRLRLGAGWDSNALLDSDPDTTQSATATYTGEAAIGWRPVANERDYLKVTGTLGYDRRPQLENLDSTKLAFSVAGARQGESLTTGASLSTARYWIDSNGAAAELRGGASLAWLRSDSADLLALELALIHFDMVADRPQSGEALTTLGEADDRSGTLAATAWRHWWQLGGGSRIESGVRAGRFMANAEMENYLLAQPWVAVRLRPVGWDINLRAGLEGRSYGGERGVGEGPENALIATANASADYRLPGTPLWVGAFVGLAARDSNFASRDYERWLAGVRLTCTFTDEE